MTKSNQIRALHADGLRPAEIARLLNCRYQFVYGVLSKAKLITPRTQAEPSAARMPKPPLTADVLVAGGFQRKASWVLSADGSLELEGSLASKPGLYAFVLNETAMYVGVTLRTLKERMNAYFRGHSSQPTNVLMRATLIEVLASNPLIEIYIYTPEDEQWHGWPMSISAGLEVGMIKHFQLPWNRKGV